MEESIEYSENKDKKCFAFLAGLLLYCLSLPYFCWSIVANPYGNSLLGILLAYLFYKNKERFAFKGRILFTAFIAIAVLYWQTSGYNFFFFLLFVPVLIIPFGNDSFVDKTYQYFLTVFSIVMAISVVEYVFAVLGVISPMFTIAPVNELKHDVYQVYFTLISMEIPPVRFSGPYDEPGVVGTMCAIILAKENFNFKDKRVVVTFLAGLLSMSLFFYLAVFICWVINILRQKKLVVSILMISVVLSLAIYLVMSVPVLTEKIAERLTFDERTEEFAGDNRVDMLIVGKYLESMEGKSFWFGISDKEYYMKLVEGSSSIYNTIIIHGWLFIICYSLFFIAYFLSHKDRKVPFVVFLFLYIAIIYQRPSMFAYFYVFLFTCMARGNSTDENDEKESDLCAPEPCLIP